MKKHKRRRDGETIGRRAITMLKLAYLGGADYGDRYAVRDALIRAGIGSAKEINGNDAAAWSRQATYELAEQERTSVTSPSRRLGYRRTAVAAPDVRELSRRDLDQHVRTRLENRLVLAESDAAQIDALPSEQLRVGLLRVQLAILEQMPSYDEVVASDFGQRTNEAAAKIPQAR